MRRKIIAANWKMYKTCAETESFIKEFKELSKGYEEKEIVICPPFTSLYVANKLLEDTPIKLGAQNMFWEKEGAYTGEISPIMLKDLNCSYVIIGHSERRQYFSETNDMINKKLKSAFEYELIPIFCVGEKWEEREKGKTEEVITEQVKKGLQGLEKEKVEKIVIAYEPVWAIGTGHSAKGEDANEVAKLIRRIISEIYDEEVSQKVRIQYGGSVNPQNIKEFLAQSEIDGALVGGASLKPQSFWDIVRS
ncbi:MULTISPECIES: triose-phosphate isomerase [Dictyoglomus]|uniref:Triosephosphate isomerase n=1 Tax=Dictyoglomus turgidum (strain DSM 6724 / Z-1310) TaxID=515635 RepID=TPIS_DICTD|nr:MULTISPECIES: triose-phosphate isomerase [Dictyoglomus]B8E2R2.1 RecName: Full=Triosephosphate isomerase; Short=TIM; Short=TPI; AltName: Full=Triose-phosphate isomerase [Dictyoglomus turgidum DSM 6724]ACK42412.1 Triose-phosphate isomerase [Dictyoglomus turgidum DSM 6724]PNV80713.1 MAG: triose-phosphate isomerase [Dictyoglomus turgidum]HBU32132.1 triose-phosphate isomerase [Dictyoglomus sp.]